MAGCTNFISRVTSHHLIDGCGMVEKPIGRVAHRAHHREFVIHFCKIREQFGKVNPWEFRLNWFKY